MIGAPILALVGDNVATSYLIRICFVFLNNFGVLVLIVLPKLFKCAMGQGDVLPDVNLTTNSRKSRVTQGPNNNVHGSSKSGASNSRTPRFDDQQNEDEDAHSRLDRSVNASFTSPHEQAPQDLSRNKTVSFAESASCGGDKTTPWLKKDAPKDDVFALGKAKGVFSSTGWSEAVHENDDDDDDDDDTPSDEEGQAAVQEQHDNRGSSLATTPFTTFSSDRQNGGGGGNDDDDDQAMVDAAVNRLTRSNSKDM